MVGICWVIVFLLLIVNLVFFKFRVVVIFVFLRVLIFVLFKILIEIILLWGVVVWGVMEIIFLIFEICCFSFVWENDLVYL